MDNRRIDIVSESDDDLRRALEIIWQGRRATYFRVVKAKEHTSYYWNPLANDPVRDQRQQIKTLIERIQTPNHLTVVADALALARLVRPLVAVDDQGAGNALCTHHFTNLRVVGVGGIDTLVLFTGEVGAAEKLPYPLATVDAAFSFVRYWLQDAADYGREPDHDGDNGRGFRVFTEEWGHVLGEHAAIVAVQPAWAMYGK